KPNKNVQRLVRALKGISCVLDIVGEIDEELNNMLIENRVEFQQAQSLTESQILKKYESADIVSFVSTYEGFGMPIVEANTVGRVVVTSNILSMPEVAGNAARLVDPFDVGSIRE
ncbi:MAG: glycosyltransferase, partial [Flammeovirgaceae bacterium]